MTAVITWVLVLFLLASDEEPGGAFQGGPWMFAGLQGASTMRLQLSEGSPICMTRALPLRVLA